MTHRMPALPPFLAVAALAAWLAAGLGASAAEPRAGAAPWEPADWQPAFAEMKADLKALLRLDTTNPPGNEILAARYLKETLTREGIPSEIFTSSGTRSSLVARVKGDGSKRPLLLMCHTDVVPVERERWSVDPFGAVEKDGYVYGRGAADIKGMCAAELMTLKLLKRSGAPLVRDVIFFAQADEEVGAGEGHLAWLLREHGDAVDAEYGLNEGGHTLWSDGRVAAVHLQSAEKQYLDVTLVARGSPGHASVPRPDNPIDAVARALTRLAAWKPPLERNPVAVGFLRATTPASSSIRAALVAKLSGPDWEAAARDLEAVDPELGSLFHDTVVATMLRAGYKENVVPSEAQATVNCRLMPGRDPASFARALAAVIQEPSVELRYEPGGAGAPGPMPLDTALHAALERSLGELWPGATLAPLLSAWSTDAPSIRARGTIVYGFDPPMTSDDAARAHGNDERIGLDALEAYLRLLYRVTARLAAPQRT